MSDLPRARSLAETWQDIIASGGGLDLDFAHYEPCGDRDGAASNAERWISSPSGSGGSGGRRTVSASLLRYQNPGTDAAEDTAEGSGMAGSSGSDDGSGAESNTGSEGGAPTSEGGGASDWDAPNSARCQSGTPPACSPSSGSKDSEDSGVSISGRQASFHSQRPGSTSGRRRDRVKRRAVRAGRGTKSTVQTAVAALKRSFTEYRDAASQTFIEASSLSKVADLGSGAFAHVEWAVWRQPSGVECNVAVKRLKPHLITGDQELADFVNEGQCLRKLKHPSIVEFVGLGFRSEGAVTDAVKTDSMFIVQEFMNGGTLKLMVLEQMVAHNRAVYSFRDALRWMTQLAEALVYLHGLDQKIVHRDLKLENVLLTENSEGRLNAKLADFGLHAIVNASDRNESVKRIKSMSKLPPAEADDPAAASAAASKVPSKEKADQDVRLDDSRLDKVLSVDRPVAASMLDDDRRSFNRSFSAGAAPRTYSKVQDQVKRSASDATHGALMAPRGRGLSVTWGDAPPPASRAAAAEARGSATPTAGSPLNPSLVRTQTTPLAQAAAAAVAAHHAMGAPPASPAAGSPGRSRLGLGSSRLARRSSMPTTADSVRAALASRPAGSNDLSHAEQEQELLRVASASHQQKSRVFQRLASTLAPGRQASLNAKYDMTGQTGSYMYMAPEVMNSKSYNEKVDIFSMAVVMFEVFAKSVTGAALLTTGDVEECEMYAWKVAHGYRRPIPTWWPPQLAHLVVTAWADDPDQRPTAAEILRRLKEMGASGVIAKMDGGADADDVLSKGCCSIQ